MNQLKIFTLSFTLLASALSMGCTSTASAAEISFERDASLPLVYVTVAFRGGSTQDPDGKNGATDVMAKLMLRGTKSKTKSQIDMALDEVGANLSVETKAEYVALRGEVLSENLKPFLSLLSEIITTPSFRTQELEKLKKEDVSNLLDDLSQDRSLARLRFEQVYFKGHPYSKSNDGRVKDIKELTQADITRQYQKLINGGTMITLAAGDANEPDFKSFVSGIEKARPAKVALTPVPDFNGDPKKLRVMVFDKPDRTQTQVVIGQRGVSFQDSRLDSLELANYAFGGGTFQSRLMVELRVKRGWTYGASSNFKLGNHPHTWRLAFFPKNSDTPPAIKEALALVHELKDKGLTQEEFDNAKQSMINSSGFNFNTPGKRLENKLAEKIYGLPNGYFKDSASRLNKLNLAQVNAALKSFLTPDQMFVGVVATAAISRDEIGKSLGIPERDVEVQDYQKE
jgi:zinc protease